MHQCDRTNATGAGHASFTRAKMGERSIQFYARRMLHGRDPKYDDVPDGYLRHGKNPVSNTFFAYVLTEKSPYFKG